jgi:subtilase family serine protease
LTQNISLPTTVLGDGYLLVKTDNYDNQIETDETDNVKAIAITATRPNLVVTDITAPTIAGSGQEITVSWTVQNQGGVDTYNNNNNNNNWYDRFVYSVDNVWGNEDDVNLNDFYPNWYGNNIPLASDASYTLSQNIYLPTSALGDGYLLVKTDIYGYQIETNETDNVKAVAIAVKRPHLVVTDITAPKIIGSGQSITVSWTVQNQGNINTYNNDWHDRVVYSVDNVWGNEDDINL